MLTDGDGDVRGAIFIIAVGKGATFVAEESIDNAFECIPEVPIEVCVDNRIEWGIEVADPED